MNTDELKCRLCGADIFEAMNRGAYLRRVNPTGEDFIGECRPSCTHDDKEPNVALINAIEQG